MGTNNGRSSRRHGCGRSYKESLIQELMSDWSVRSSHRFAPTVGTRSHPIRMRMGIGSGAGHVNTARIRVGGLLRKNDGRHITIAERVCTGGESVWNVEQK